eukprot:CAMPEP_0181178306 /NCGR_PEP_ID=MMETSP1096-20121128/5654_1 /TAXON_ID=156174 ORGANISM="Chrysochromulina ericina, Strain CCMP281" /NCGR_SAMPLE_ID=MMETSP1096 /ASSEMBLY_ACC=CAM_ASM_000453 /LENGTH=694 /DNA_ID=CAMNT_0023266575 /DNA_START=24 /DNA_END=2108 /DNA_ORIENTATION=-
MDEPTVSLHTQLTYNVVTAGPEMDHVIAENWREQWLANGRPASMVTEDQMEKMINYIMNAREKLGHRSFVALSPTGEVVGSAACQLWCGPIPQPTEKKVGTVWGVFVSPKWRRQGVATQLMESVMGYWRSLGCERGVLLCASEEARRIYERLGFGEGNVMLLDLKQPCDLLTGEMIAGKEPCSLPGDVVISPAAEDMDAQVARHWRDVWIESGVPPSEFVPKMEEHTMEFITAARQRLEYQAFVARDATGAVVGSISCQVWEGPGSNNHTWQRLIKIGVVWGMYVWTSHRRQGIEARLLEQVVARLRAIGCTKGFAYAASSDEATAFKSIGFQPHNAMVVELDYQQRPLHSDRAQSPLSPMDLWRRPRAEATLTADDAILTAEEEAFVASVRSSGAKLALQMSPARLAALRLALPQMLEATLPISQAGQEMKAAVIAAQHEVGTFIDPEDNWFTQNISRFGGGFDMAQLMAQPGRLAAKFDRLSDKYDQWTVGNRCTYYDWLAKAAATAPELRSATATVIDVACGIGLPGHMLRLCGFQGRMLATDISPGMLSHARERRVFDSLFVANANEGLALADGSIDLIVCFGAMELLDHRVVLAEFARVLKPGGTLWASFQWEGATDADGAAMANPTEHQNVHGVTLLQLTAELEAAGFDAQRTTIDKSACAFYTPSPQQDGSLLPVPYLYVACHTPKS